MLATHWGEMAPLQEGIEEQENYKTVGEGFGLLAASEIIVFGC